jgi:glucose/mannose-6-phosphate isomerase
MLDDLKYIHFKDASDALGAAARRFADVEAVEQWRPDVATAHNPAKQLAQELMGKTVVVYSGPEMYSAAEAWKVACNANARQLAWCARIDSESELLGWTEQPIDKLYAVVELRSNLESGQVQRFFDGAERLLSGMRPAPIVVEVRGTALDEQRLWAAAYGEFVTLYLGLLNGIDPSPTALLEKFKKALEK